MSSRGNAALVAAVYGDEHFSDVDLNCDTLNGLILLMGGFPGLDYTVSKVDYPIGKYVSLFKNAKSSFECHIFTTFKDHHLVRLCFIVTLVKSIITFEADCNIDASSVTREDKELGRLVKEIAEVSGCADHTLMKSNNVSGSDIALTPSQALKAKLLRFLRCAALYMHFLTDVPLPSKIENHQSNPDKIYSKLCTYLDLPTGLVELIQSAGFSKVVDACIAQLHQQKALPPPNPPKRRNLVKLKHTYLDILKMADEYTCPRKTDENKNPALCLVCGGLFCCLVSFFQFNAQICSSPQIEKFQTNCCRDQINGTSCGGCTVHAQTCSGGMGIFLIIRKCKMVLLSDVTRGAFLPAPYVDEFGETDEGMRRGNPLTFSQDLWEDLNTMWLNNDVPDRISRRFDGDYVTIRASWHLH